MQVIDLLEYTGGIVATDLVQGAIDAAARAGETLVVPPGVYEVTGLTLPAGCDLYLSEGAELRAVPREEAWAVCPRMPLLFAENATNIKVRGRGRLNGSGWAFVDELGFRKKTPNLPGGVIAFRNVGNIEISGITITETVGWTLHLDDCDRVLIDGVIIRNPTYNTRKNSDGIDLNGCREVEVKNCNVETGDDGICLKNFDRQNPTAPRRVMENIHVHHCRVASTCNATKIGTET
ncbi:MAG: right-handed parallel beta-helix repeat-containing protein, partial [Clostridia bacterium]|nr:right-handed parallel beta-helix repeat-containing protein [Clostridia bacterium]